MSATERRHAALGALLGIALSIWALEGLPIPGFWLLAPMGASGVILFGMPNSPVAQPWPLVGGYLSALVAGFLAAALIPVPALAAGTAVALCLWLMARFNCIHPPGGALALLIVLDQRTFVSSGLHTLELVAANVGLLILAATLLNNLIPGRRYPHRAAPAASSGHATRDLPTLNRGDLDREDLMSAMRQMDTFVDVREDELETLYRLAIDHAFHRHVGLRCADVMSTDVVTTRAGACLGDAWELLQRHGIKALPVIDAGRTLVGILTLSDIFRVAGATPDWRRMRVADSMTRDPGTALPTTAMADLVAEVARTGRHHLPVVDDSGKLVGMLTQSDIIGALYHRIALQPDERSRPVRETIPSGE